MKFAFLIEPPFNFRDGNGAVTGCDVELALRQAVDEALLLYLGSEQHRAMMRGFRFSDAEVDLVAG